MLRRPVRWSTGPAAPSMRPDWGADMAIEPGLPNPRLSAPRAGDPQARPAPSATIYPGLLAHRRLEIGDPAAPFVLPDHSGTHWSPLDNDIAGKPLLLLFHLQGSTADLL